MNQQPCILVVDDEPKLLQATARQLRKANYVVIEARTGEVGLTLASKQQPDLILLDVVLPDIDGVEVCRRLKANPATSDALVVLLSSFRIESDSQADGLEAGADGYIARPISNRELLARIKGLIRLKRAETALRVSEERFSLATQGANDGLWDWDIANQTLYWSPRLQELLGYAEDELEVEFETFEALLHPDDRAQTRAAIEAHLTQGEPYSVEHRLLAKSGEYRWHSARGQALWDEAGQPVRMVGITSDITDRKQAEEELEQRAAQLMLINQIGSQIGATRAVDQVLHETARLIQAAFDYHHVALFLVEGERLTLESIAGSYERYFPPGHSQPLTAGINGWVARHGEKVVVNDVTAEPRYASLTAAHSITQSELCLPIKVAGQTVGVLDIQSPRLDGFCRNDVIAMEALTHQIAVAIENARLHEAVQQELAERKQTEAKLAEERNLLRTLIDNLPEYIYVKDRQSRFVVANVALARLMGGSGPEDLIGQTDFDFYPPELAGQYNADEQQVINAGQPLIDKEEPLVEASGRTGWLLTTKVPLMNDTGRVTGVVGLGRDITERKQLEQRLQEYSERLEEMVEERTQELRTAQEQLVRREKLAVLGQLSGGLAHQLRNPLGNVKNAGYLLKMAANQPEPAVKEALEILDTEINRAERIISSLLDFARTRVPNRVTVNLDRLLREVVAQVTLPDAPPIELVVEAAGDLPPVQSDPDQLSQVFDNLLWNAVQAMPAGGRLAIRTGLVEPGWVAVSVADSGIGIPPADLSKIFEPLFTTKPKGLGLGLALIRNLVEANGGCIRVESEVGRGSTFTVQLPVDESEKKIGLNL